MSEDPDDKRSFLYRHVSASIPTIYILSENIPKSDHSLFNVEPKNFSPILRVGDALQFSVRVNPIVARRVDGKARSTKHDVVMNEKKKRNNEGQYDVQMQELISETVGNWISKRGEANGFSVELNSLIYSEYTQRRFYKPKSTRPIHLSTVDISGILYVTDTNKFQSCLRLGLGSAKGFGCGLLMIKPAQ